MIDIHCLLNVNETPVTDHSRQKNYLSLEVAFREVEHLHFKFILWDLGLETAPTLKDTLKHHENFPVLALT